MCLDVFYDPTHLCPHPLSQRPTELVWAGKYDEYGDRREAELSLLRAPRLIEYTGNYNLKKIQ